MEDLLFKFGRSSQCFSLIHVFTGLLDVVRHCSYIGMADDVLALLQHDTHLYVANVVNLR